MLKILTEISRVLVGTVFIISGLVKSNDIWGFVYKLEEYYEPGALNMEYLTPYALEIAIFVVIGEILLGVAILFGALPKLTTVLTLFMMVFFTWLTYYTSHCDPTGTVEIVNELGVKETIDTQCVLECGCFGNAIPLLAIQSFYKDVIILFLFIPFVISAFGGRIKLNTRKENMYIIPASILFSLVFSLGFLNWPFATLFVAILLGVGAILLKRLNRKYVVLGIFLSTLIIASAFQWKAYTHLPHKEYTPYAIGESIRENRKTAEELGLPSPQFATEYTFKNKKSGQDTMILSTDYLKIYNKEWFKNGFELVTYEGKSIKVPIYKKDDKGNVVLDADGNKIELETYEPKIQDLNPTTYEGDEIVDDIIGYKGYTFFFISKNLKNSNTSNVHRISELAKEAQHNNIRFYGLSNSPYEEAEEFRHQYQLPFEFLEMDFIELKMMIRDNPGLMLIHDGVVVDKWAWRDFPTWNDVKDELK